MLGQDRTRWDVSGRIILISACSCAGDTIAATDGLNALRIGMTYRPGLRAMLERTVAGGFDVVMCNG